MTKKKIPNVEEILTMFDEKTKFRIQRPSDEHRETAEENAKTRAEEAFFKDFASVTFGDYINAVHSFNREMMSSMDPLQTAAYYTFFVYEESLKRIEENENCIN